MEIFENFQGPNLKREEVVRVRVSGKNYGGKSWV